MTMPTPEMVGLLARLGDALGTASRPLTLETELKRSVANVRSVFAASACSCALVEDDGAALRFVAADGAGAAEIIGVSLPIGRGIAGWVAMSGQPIVVSNVADDSRFARDVAEATNYVPTVILAAPLVDADGEIAGVIEVLDPQARGDHSGHDLGVLGLVATQLATTIRLAERYDAIGTELLRTIADPDATGESDAALGQLVDEAASAALHELANAFRAVAAGGPEAAQLAARILNEVGAFTRARS